MAKRKEASMSAKESVAKKAASVALCAVLAAGLVPDNALALGQASAAKRAGENGAAGNPAPSLTLVDDAAADSLAGKELSDVSGDGAAGGKADDKALSAEVSKQDETADAYKEKLDASVEAAAGGTLAVNAEGEGGEVSGEEYQAPESQDVSAAWPSFRGNNCNNGIVNFDMPTSVDETQLLWKVKMGTGWSAAPSTQLIVDDSLVFMSGTKIYKANLSTGAILAEGDLCDTFNWGYTPFAYGEGKIFVSLASGKVQAFDAATLESLWVYADPLKGQSVSPVVYSDGYVYTGFWNSEKKDANYVCLKAEDEDKTKTDEAKEATWSFANTGGYYWAGALAAGNYLVFGGDDGITAESGGTSHLYCVNKYTGALVSELELSGLGDQRSSICYAPELGKIFFTTKGGYICSAYFNASNGQLGSLTSLHVWEGAQSTSTPVYYKGKIYFGIGSAYSGGEFCRFVVADAVTLETIASVRTPGDVKSSPLLSTATEESGYLSFYFTCNIKPGGIYVARVQNDCRVDTDIELEEIYNAAGVEEYCISSVIASSDGAMYYKNDSGNIFAVGFTNEGRDAAAQRHATAFEQAVDALFPITIDSGDAIAAAQAQERALSSAAREKVSADTFDKLVQAQERFAELQSDKKAADDFTEMVDVLFPVTIDSGDAIAAARKACDALTEGQRAFVTSETFGALSQAESEYQALLIEDEKIRQIAQAVAALFPVTPTPECKAAIDKVQDMLDALNVLEMERVPASVLNSFKMAKEQHQQLLADRATAEAFANSLDALFPVTLENGENVVAARATYNAMTDSQKSFVSEEALEKLEQAEADYQKLLDDKAAVDAFNDLVRKLSLLAQQSKDALDQADAALAALTPEQRAQVSPETLKMLEQAKADFAALNGATDNPSSDEGKKDNQQSGGTSSSQTGGATRSLSSSEVSTDDESAADEVVYTAVLPGDEEAVAAVADAPQQQSGIPWQGILIAAAALLAGVIIGRLSSPSGNDEDDEDSKKAV